MRSAAGTTDPSDESLDASSEPVIIPAIRDWASGIHHSFVIPVGPPTDAKTIGNLEDIEISE
jgi:hypothetical protein